MFMPAKLPYLLIYQIIRRYVYIETQRKDCHMLWRVL